MRVQLFVPPGGYFAERWSKGSSMPPLGLLYIGAVLEKEGVEVEIVPADILKMGWGDIVRKVRDGRPDIVGVTSTTENRFQSFELVRLATKTYPPAPPPHLHPRPPPLPGLSSCPLRKVQLQDRGSRRGTSSGRQHHDQPRLPLQLQLLRHPHQLG